MDEQAPVGRVGIDHVDLAGGGCLVLQRLLELAHLPEGKPVMAPQPRQAVVTLGELEPDPGPQLGRERHEVGNAAQPVLLGQSGGNCQLEGVLETERGEPPHVEPIEELGPHPTKGVDGVPLGRGPENRHEAGAGVLRVQIDRAAAQRLEADLRPGEIQPALDGVASTLLEQTREHLGQQAVLGEVLRSDDDRILGRRGTRRNDQRRQPEDDVLREPAHDGAPGRGASSART